MSSFARCIGCGCIDDTTYMVPVSLANRGGRRGYMCNTCAEKKESYYDENDSEHGKRNNNPCTYGMELETDHSSESARAHLYQYDFLPTYDCTCDVEYKSPIFQNMKSLPHLCKEIEKMKMTGDIEIGSGCGTHFHVGYREHINSDTMCAIYRKHYIYTRLFSALSNAISADDEKARNIFGRTFSDTDWAYRINENSYPSTHENFINVQHDNTFEFRIMFFRDAEQYMRGIRLCDKITKTVVEQFGMKYMDIRLDSKKLDHKLDVVSKKLVKLYENA